MIENKRVTGYTLKMIALITMLVDHVAAVLLWRMYVASYKITGSMQLSNQIGDKIIVWIADNQDIVYTVYELMRYIGRMAFPIYCFLLVEGFLHTSNVKKYALRLLAFAFISEIPFDLSITGKWWSYSYNNVFFTLLLGLIAIWALSYIEKFYEFWQEKEWEPILGCILVAIAGIIVVSITGGIAEMVLFTDYGFGGIIAIVILYLFRRQRVMAFALCVLALSVVTDSTEILAMFMLYPIMRYEGTRGKQMKYLYYAFYPAHLLILALICMAFGV